MHLISDGNCLVKTIQRLRTAIFQWGLHNIQLETTTLLSRTKRVLLKLDGKLFGELDSNNNHEVRVTHDIILRLFGKKNIQRPLTATIQ